MSEQNQTKTQPKRLYVRTYGCQMNVYDSQRMADVMASHGYAVTETPDDADLIVLNTCHIREKAAEKVYADLGRLRPLKDSARQPLLVVAGCVAQAEGAEITTRAPYVDVVLGPQTYHRLPEMVARAVRDRGTPVLETDFPSESKFDHLPTPGARGPSAFLSIQEGCDKFCTFCVVPYTRGAEVSRPAQAVVDEARALVASGTVELTLLGQNVNAYHGEGPDGATWSLGRLIRALAEIEGLARLRYTTSHPRDVDADLIAAHRDVPQLMPFLHLPVQSGSDRILEAMNRGHTADTYRHIVDDLKAARPDLALSSDFIVGFPGETDADHKATLRLARDMGFIQAYSFKYSRRPGTPAAAQRGQVPEAVKTDRLAALQAVLNDNQQRFNDACVGLTLDVLLDRDGKHPGQLLGRSPYMQPVHVTAPALAKGRLVPLRILAAHPHSLAGEPVPLDALRQSA